MRLLLSSMGATNPSIAALRRLQRRHHRGDPGFNIDRERLAAIGVCDDDEYDEAAPLYAVS